MSCILRIWIWTIQPKFHGKQWNFADVALFQNCPNWSKILGKVKIYEFPTLKLSWNMAVLGPVTGRRRTNCWRNSSCEGVSKGFWIFSFLFQFHFVLLITLKRCFLWFRQTTIFRDRESNTLTFPGSEYKQVTNVYNVLPLSQIDSYISTFESIYILSSYYLFSILMCKYVNCSRRTDAILKMLLDFIKVTRSRCVHSNAFMQMALYKIKTRTRSPL